MLCNERVITVKSFPTILSLFSILSGFTYLFMVTQEKSSLTGTTYNPLAETASSRVSISTHDFHVDPRVQVIVAFSEDLEPHAKSRNCPVGPVERITWDSALWQRIEYENIYLWTAYYDDRYSFRGNSYHFIRIIALVRDSLSIGLTCYLWKDRTSTHSTTVPVIGTELWLDIWGKGSSVTLYKAYLFSCLVPIHLRHNVSGVSVSPHSCSKPETYIPVDNLSTVQSTPKMSGSTVTSTSPDTRSLSARSTAVTPSTPQPPPPPLPSASASADTAKSSLWLPTKQNFVTCVKPLDFSRDISTRLIEWIELQFILGASLINIYIYSVHPDTYQVLNHYSSLGKVKLFPMDLPGQLPNEPVERSEYLSNNLWQKRRLELIPYNDCFYRHIYSHQFVVLVDIDEVIVPVKDYDWKSLLTRVFLNDPKSIQVYTSFSAQNTYFLESYPTPLAPGVPSYLYMIAHVARSINFSKPGHAIKSFMSTNTSLALFNHYTLFPLYPSMKRNAFLTTSLAQLNHYKSECPRSMVEECSERFMKHWKVDKILWKYKKPLMKAINRTVKLIKDYNNTLPSHHNHQLSNDSIVIY